MHRSFEAWRKELEEDSFRFDTPETLQADLKELEEAIPFTLKEAEQFKRFPKSPTKTYPNGGPSLPFQAGPYQGASLTKTERPLTPRQAKMAQFTETLAQEVIEKLERLEQLEKRDVEREQTLRQYQPQIARVEELMRDNRTLAQQVKMLLEERTRLHDELSFYEREYPRFQKMAGNMYLKR